MKVLLIQPPYPFSEFPKPSSALIFLGTVLRQAGVEVEILDLLSTRYSVRKIEQRLSRFRPDIIGATGCLWIFPGTALYQKCKQAGFIDDEFWLSDEPYKIYTLEHSLDQLNRYHRRFLWNSIQPTRMVIRKLRKILGV